MKVYVISGTSIPIVCNSLEIANREFDKFLIAQVKKGYTYDERYKGNNIRRAVFGHPSYMCAWDICLNETEVVGR